MNVKQINHFNYKKLCHQLHKYKEEKMKKRTETSRFFALELLDAPYKALPAERNPPFVLDKSSNPQIIPGNPKVK